LQDEPLIWRQTATKAVLLSVPQINYCPRLLKDIGSTLVRAWAWMQFLVQACAFLTHSQAPAPDRAEDDADVCEVLLAPYASGTRPHLFVVLVRALGGWMCKLWNEHAFAAEVLFVFRSLALQTTGHLAVYEAFQFLGAEARVRMCVRVCGMLA
jgi:hypothetical protein